MMFRAFQKEVHENAMRHGWWDNPPELGTLIALVHSELSEALEEARKNRPMIYYACNTGRICDGDNCFVKVYSPDDPACCTGQSKKPEGIAIELADAVLRIMDMCEHYGIDLGAALRIKHEYNKARPYKHGGKRF